ncbi:hypothetical protein, partial [Deinococcus sp. DB0503]|uniref:hypothetical protein n=1 Tax=Deinococcus sp. DB0503 TaxID=2479203 RepID=UPI0018DFC37C
MVTGMRNKTKKKKKPEAIFYLDDSHSGGRILDKNFQPLPTSPSGLRPYSNSGGIIIRPTQHDLVIDEFEHLLGRIASQLSLTDLPVFHMRQLWGKNPPRDKGKNPFFEMDYNDRFYWCRQ